MFLICHKYQSNYSELNLSMSSFFKTYLLGLLFESMASHVMSTLPLGRSICSYGITYLNDSSGSFSFISLCWSLTGYFLISCSYFCRCSYFSLNVVLGCSPAIAKSATSLSSQPASLRGDGVLIFWRSLFPKQLSTILGFSHEISSTSEMSSSCAATESS